MRRFLYVLAGLLLAYIGIGYWLSSLIVSPPPRRSVTESHQRLLEGFGYDQLALLDGLPQPHEVAFASSTPHLQLRGWWFKGSDTATCGLVMAHGITENRANTLKYATVFSDCDCHMLLYDHRGHGQSDGQLLTGGALESDDVLAAVRWLADTTGLSPKQVGLVGESWGASAVLLASAKTDQVAFALADSPYTSWRDAILQRGVKQYGSVLHVFTPIAFAWVEWRTGVAMEDAAPERLASRINTPTLLVHSQQDTITPPRHSEQIVANIKTGFGESRILDWGAWHAHNALARPEAYRQMVSEFLERHQMPMCE